MGVQIVELEVLDKLMKSLGSQYLSKILILWLVHLINSDLLAQGENRFELCLIKVMYIGEYPAIGISYQDAFIENQEEFVMEKANKILTGKTVGDLLKFIVDFELYLKEEIEKYEGTNI